MLHEFILKTSSVPDVRFHECGEDFATEYCWKMSSRLLRSLAVGVIFYLTQTKALRVNDTSIQQPLSGCELTDPSTQKSRPLKILVFVDITYIDIFFNFLHYFKRVCSNDLSRLEVVCIGTSMHRTSRLLGYYGVQCSSNSFSISEKNQNGRELKLSTLSIKRLQIVHSYLSTGVDVLLTDCDAIWLKNPFPDIQKYSVASDIVASREFTPWHLSERWGACLSMGFMYIKEGGLGSKIFRRMNYRYVARTHQFNQGMTYSNDTNTSITNATVQHFDDQHALNNQLAEMMISWPHNMIVNGSHADTGVVIDNNDKGYMVTLLPHNMYVRYCLPPDSPTAWVENTKQQRAYVYSKLSEAIVVHCNIAISAGETKQIFLRAYQLWNHSYGKYSDVDPLHLDAAKTDAMYVSYIKMEQDKFGYAFDIGGGGGHTFLALNQNLNSVMDSKQIFSKVEFQRKFVLEKQRLIEDGQWFEDQEEVIRGQLKIKDNNQQLAKKGGSLSDSERAALLKKAKSRYAAFRSKGRKQPVVKGNDSNYV